MGGRVVLSGYFGFHNAGDETILFAMVQALKKISPELELTVLSSEPEKTAKLYGVKAVNRWRFTDILKALMDCDLLLSGGGSLLQDTTSAKSPFYYLWIIFLAKLLGRPVAIYAQGIGPLKGFISRKLTGWLFNRAQLITVRDDASKELLLSLGVKRSVTVTADPVLALTADSWDAAVGRDILSKYGINREPEERLLGVCIRGWQNNEFLPGLALACDTLAEAGWKVIFIPMHFPGDVQIAAEAAKLMHHEALLLNENYGPVELLSLTANMDLVVGMRLHSLIYAAVAGVPPVGISYDPKVDSFLEQIGRQSLINIQDLNPKVLVEYVSCMHEHRTEVVEEIRKRLQPLFTKAWQTGRLALQLLPENQK